MSFTASFYPPLDGPAPPPRESSIKASSDRPVGDPSDPRNAESRARAVPPFHAPQAPAQAEASLGELLYAAPIGVAESDMEGRYLRVNPWFCGLVGRSAEELVGHHIAEVTHSEDLEADLAQLRQLALGALDTYIMRKRFVRPDGSVVWTELRCSRVDRAGQPPTAVRVIQDITGEVAAAGALRQSEARKTAILESALDCIITMDSSDRIVDFNPAAERTFGYTRAEAIGRTVAELLMPERFRERHRIGLQRFLDTGVGPLIGRRVEVPALRRDGTEFPVELAIAVSSTGDEGPSFTAYLRDITERVRTQNELRQYTERLSMTMAAAKMGDWSWDPASDLLTISDRAAQMFGVPPGDPVPWSTLRERLHAEDRTRVQEAMERAYAEGGHYEIEYRIVHPGGAVTWIAAHGHAHHDPGGDGGMLGLIVDITERKRAEEARSFMAEASAELAANLDVESTLTTVAHMAVPRFADWCIVDLLEADGSLRRVAVVHRDESKVRLSEELFRKYPPGPEDLGGPYKVARSGEPESMGRITPEMIAQGARTDEHRDALLALGLHSYTCVPLVARGKTLGAITFLWAETDNAYTPEDVAFLIELGRRAGVAIDNAQLFRAKEESEQLYRTLVEQVKDYAIFMLNPAGVIVSYNEGVGRVLGYEEGEFIGMNGRELFLPEDRRAGESERELETAASAAHAGNDRWMMKKDGTPFFATGVTTALRNERGEVIGYSKVMRDMTDWKRVQDALARSEQRFRLVADAAPVLIWVADPSGDRTWFNRQWLEFTGRTLEQEFGRGWTEDVHPDDLERCLGLYTEGFAKRREFRMEYRLRRADGKFRWVLAQAMPIQGGLGEFTGFIGTCIDIHDRKQAQEDLERHAADLARSNADLESFAYVASHDLKEPLRGISTQIGFLEEAIGPGRVPAEARERIDSMQRLSRRMYDLLDALLEYSRVGRSQVEARPTDLNEVVYGVLETLHPRLQAAGAEVDVHGRLPIVHCDRILAAQVFTNLIINGVKYNTSTPKRIEIGHMHPEGGVGPPILYVKDNGIGIPERHREAIFRMFKRLHPREAYGGGIGAGLAIVKRIIERHGGRIWLTSEEGRGTTFFFTFEGAGRRPEGSAG